MHLLYKLLLIILLQLILFGPSAAQEKAPIVPVVPPSVKVDSALVQEEVNKIIEILKKGQPTSSPARRSSNSTDLEIDGLVVDNTITKIGKDFFDVFYNGWEAPPEAKNFTVVIKELPFRGQNAQVEITVNDEIVFENFIQPRIEILEELAQYAVAVVYDFITNDQLRQQLEAEGKRTVERF